MTDRSTAADEATNALRPAVNACLRVFSIGAVRIALANLDDELMAMQFGWTIPKRGLPDDEGRHDND